MFIPKDNEKDLPEISDEITKDLQIVAVTNIDEIIERSLVEMLNTNREQKRRY